MCHILLISRGLQGHSLLNVQCTFVYLHLVKSWNITLRTELCLLDHSFWRIISAVVFVVAFSEKDSPDLEQGAEGSEEPERQDESTNSLHLAIKTLLVSPSVKFF